MIFKEDLEAWFMVILLGLFMVGIVAGLSEVQITDGNYKAKQRTEDVILDTDAESKQRDSLINKLTK